ncbi:MAG TPA: adenylate/guanylate cyclase domain-containing protein [Actinomycetota bacterium]|nr:adenylate/guanylate cyclase domain-containing protein [Actinomycetota bacterium]
MGAQARPSTQELKDRARDSLAHQAWQDAYELLSQIDEGNSLSEDELTSFASAAYLSGHPDVSLEVWERAHEQALQQNARQEAALAAVRVAHLLRDGGQEALFHAWIRRAEGLLEGLPESAAHGHLAVARAVGVFVWGDLTAARADAAAAAEIGIRLGDPAIVALGKNIEGRALVLMGEVEAGLALLDESALAALSGRVDPMTASILFCSTVCALHTLSEFERAEEWTQAAERLGHRHAIGVYHGWCRVHSAEAMRFRGAWTAAEEEAALAVQELKPYIGIDRGIPMAILGEIRLRRGDLSGAEQAMLESYELGWEPQPGYALLRLARGNAEAAAASIREAIEHPSQAPSRELPPNNELRMVPLLAAQAEIALATGDLDRALWAAGELDRIADLFETKAVRAVAATVLGTVALSRGDPDAARVTLQGAVQLWQEVGAPYEVARSRVALGQALRAVGQEERAAIELRSAHRVFEELGAQVDAARTARIIGEARVAVPASTSRETRVFMFTDIVQSTDLARLIGDDAWEFLVRWHDELLASLVAAHHGEVVRMTGDGVFATFADAHGAIGCAVAIQRALLEHRLEHGFAPSVRIGLHAAEATREESDWSGVGVHAASRIGALAQGEEILVSSATAKAAGDAFPYSEPHVVPLKGLSEPYEVLAVQWR